MTKGSADTQEFATPAGASVLRPPEQFSSIVQVAGLSHPGKVRPNNEDHFLVARFGRFFATLQTNLAPGAVPLSFEDTGYGLAVADGMGGHAAGEEASRLAISIFVNLVLSTPDWILRVDDPSSAEEVMRRAEERFGQVDEALAEQAENDPKLHGFGTTMTLAASLAKDLFIGHIGDSRAYLFRKAKLHQLTRDHTLVRELYETGVITRAQAATHHLRHALTRHLGGQRGARADVQKVALENGDCLLLCSDGLNEMVSDDQIAAILADGDISAQTCQRLIDRALAAGGKDNVTVIVARYCFP
jgi:protein phosphatase